MISIRLFSQQLHISGLPFTVKVLRQDTRPDPQAGVKNLNTLSSRKWLFLSLLFSRSQVGLLQDILSSHNRIHQLTNCNSQSARHNLHGCRHPLFRLADI